MSGQQPSDVGQVSTTPGGRTVRGRVISCKMDKTVTVLVERRMYFLYSGCCNRRSTKTVTVLSILQLITRPLTVRPPGAVLTWPASLGS